MTLQDQVNVHIAEERQQEQHRTTRKKAAEKLSKARQITVEYDWKYPDWPTEGAT